MQAFRSTDSAREVSERGIGRDLALSRARQPGLWGIVLAGGEGERLRGLSEKLAGYPCPKQYCSILGEHSMIQHTLARAESLIPPQQILVVAGKGHQKEIEEQLPHRPRGTILFQPRNRETAPGVLLPLTWIARWDPRAIVVILPSDHFILEEARFMAHVRRATVLIEQAQECCILLGVDPDAPETGYGWIEPLPAEEGEGLYRVRGFYEKPDRVMAARLYQAGCLWNTLVVVAKVATLLQLYRAYLPDLYDRFQRIAPVLGTAGEREALEEVYAGMPAINISRSLFQENPPNLRTLRVTGVLWSDWGSPRRIRQTLERIGRLPELALKLLRRGHNPEEVLGSE